MSGGFQVDPAELADGVSQINGLSTQAETIIRALADTFQGLIAAVGDDGVASSLAELDQVCAARLMDLLALYTHVGETLADNADTYQRTEDALLARIHALRGGRVLR